MPPILRNKSSAIINNASPNPALLDRSKSSIRKTGPTATEDYDSEDVDDPSSYYSKGKVSSNRNRGKTALENYAPEDSLKTLSGPSGNSSNKGRKLVPQKSGSTGRPDNRPS